MTRADKCARWSWKKRVGGEQLVFFCDLTEYGALDWHGESRNPLYQGPFDVGRQGLADFLANGPLPGTEVPKRIETAVRRHILMHFPETPRSGAEYFEPEKPEIENPGATSRDPRLPAPPAAGQAEPESPLPPPEKKTPSSATERLQKEILRAVQRGGQYRTADKEGGWGVYRFEHGRFVFDLGSYAGAFADYSRTCETDDEFLDQLFQQERLRHGPCEVEVIWEAILRAIENDPQRR